MLTNHAKLIQFFSVAKVVTGRKKLQKMIYILQKCHVPFEEKYQFHFYGPYSEELSLRVEELTNLGFIKEQKEEKSSYHQYNYEITNDGQMFLDQFSLDMPDYSSHAAALKSKSSRFLELVSTLLFFDELTRSEAVEKVHIVKPKQKFTAAEIDEAWQFIDALKENPPM